MLYLLSEKRSYIFVVLYEVYLTPKQFFQILGGEDMIIELRWHRGKKINITPLMVLITGDGAK